MVIAKINNSHMSRTRKFTVLCLFLIIVAGFVFRLTGIISNHSFWSDEAFVSGLARDFLIGKRNVFESILVINHQTLHFLTTLGSFALIGVSEFSARLPSVIFGTIGILAAFLLALNLSNIYGGILAAFVFAFAQINLANSTQAKPYSALQTLFLMELYLVSLAEKSKKTPFRTLLLLFVIAALSSLFHPIGLLSWIPILTFLFRHISIIRESLFKQSRRVLFIFSLGIAIGLIVSIIAAYRFTQSGGESLFFPYNQTTYLRELFVRQYALFSLPALMGVLLIFSSNQTTFLSVLLYTITILYLWNFKHSTHNIRYLLPLFGIIFVSFGTFWAKVGENLFKRKPLLITLLVALVLYAGGYKIVRKPSVFYNPNADFYGDVQIADYKNAFAKLEARFGTNPNFFIVNNWYDAHYWYWPTRPPDAYFMIGTVRPYRHWLTGKMVYGTLPEFTALMKSHSKGLLIVEDWQSILPTEIKEYAKKNLKKELRIDGLREAQGDNWPIEAYSWGLD